MVQFGILGPLQVLAAGEELALGGVRERVLLALLLVEAPAAVSVDRLIDELWGERPPATALHAVQVYVSALRKLLCAGGDEVTVRRSASGYALDVDLGSVDARRFERLIEEGKRALLQDPSRGRALLESALRLWRGRPLGDFSQFEFARREGDRLEELHARALECLVGAQLACGEHSEVISTLTGLVAADPLREGLRRMSMIALYRSGRQAEALAVYRDACRALDEIGLQPGPELRALEAAILRHDPSLATRASGGPLHASGVRAREAESTQPLRRTRKVVTALFLDLLSPGTSAEHADPEAQHEAIARCLREVRGTIEAHGGGVERIGVDEVVAMFGVPQSREDDALRAVRAAAEIRARLPAVATGTGTALGFRAALNTGLVLCSDDENPTLGEPVTVAARMLRAGPPGEILLGEETLRLVRGAVEVEPFGPVAMKGDLEPVPAFRLAHLDPVAAGYACHLGVPLVGRERELGMLRAAWARAAAESECHLFTLLGVAGIGKSRLVAELLASLGESATVLRGRCLHYGEGITFWPLTEALAPVGEEARAVLERLDAGGAASPQELFFEVRQLLESLARKRAVILHIDDLQWAQPMLLALLEHVIDLSRGTAILVLCTARTELFEATPTWGGGKLNATSALLEPLQKADCETLLDLLGSGLGDEVRARVVAASEGNPLFLQEIAALARERGTVDVPPTIQALLQARLESIPVAEREVLELGAIEGEVFHQRALQELAAENFADEIHSSLDALVRKRLIGPHPATLQDDAAFRFAHLLIRDAAYAGVTKATRAQLHERLAGWMERNAGELAELDEIAGWHLEQTVRYQHDIGAKDDSALTTRAAEHLYAAGTRAARRGDTRAARTMLERAHVLATHNAALAARIGVDLAEALMEGGDITRVDALLTAAERDHDAAAYAALPRLHWMTLAQPADAVRTIEAVLPQTLERLANAGDEHGLAKAHLAAYWAKTQAAAQATEAGEQALLAAEHARKAGEKGLRARALAMWVTAILYGPNDAATMARELDAIEIDDAPYLEALITIARGEVQRLDGNFNECRQLMQSGIERLHAMGIHTIPAAAQSYLAWGELYGGEPASALPGLLRADATLASFGERGFRSTVQATLARVYERVGEYNQARGAVNLADELAATDDSLTVTIASAAHARLALIEEDPDVAERWARNGVEHAYRTDIPFLRATALLELSRVLAERRRPNDSRAAITSALELLQAKGDQPRISYARELFAQLDATPSHPGTLGI